MKKYLKLTSFTRINEEWVDNTINCIPLSYRYCDTLIQGAPNTTRFQADFYKSIALDIVAETVYHYPYPYISEKTFRPISCKKLFIIIGAPGTLQLLKNYGFDVFSDIIDDKYDTIVDPIKRWYKLEEVIKEFTAMPLETVKDILKSVEHRLDKNFQILQNLEQVEITKLNDTD